MLGSFSSYENVVHVLEKKFNSLISLFRNFGERYEAGYGMDYGYGVIDTTQEDAEFEKNLPLFFENYTFFVSQFYQPDYEKIHYSVIVEEYEKETKNKLFSNVEEATRYVENHLPDIDADGNPIGYNYRSYSDGFV